MLTMKVDKNMCMNVWNVPTVCEGCLGLFFFLMSLQDLNLIDICIRIMKFIFFYFFAMSLIL